MYTQMMLGRFAATVALAGYIGFFATPRANATETAMIAQHGYWSSVVDTTDDGRHMCGVRTRMTNGGELRLEVIDDEIHLIAHDDRWHMMTNGTSHVTITVDGEDFTGDGKAVNGQTLVVASLTRGFIERFMDGDEMIANFGGVRWDVNLVGSSQVAAEMAACATRGRSDWMS